MSNAIKYSDPEKAARTVQIDAALDDRHELCAIRVRDNGIGIAEVDLPSIFSRFRRGHEERDAELGASGLELGLSIVAECVQVLAATIHVESTPGCGTVFSLEVPMVASVQATMRRLSYAWTRSGRMRIAASKAAMAFSISPLRNSTRPSPTLASARSGRILTAS